ncbi:hypothetical protein MOK15_21465 [Sphingobium sp. BYY-5]|uniref:hypothetical protein n=1 Tax=Sphingobium sp. BYY-5 TaxID=2926400 RepID=UPI001FA78DF0|nr:hypothetical protein [Sphingobium sp. BYY-5]MCI4592629.1 hypothetical protein [Sphingobium sp. BYY-5]
MLRTAMIALALILPAGSAMAQDIGPVISPSQAAEGAFHRSRMGAQAKAMRDRKGVRPSAGPQPGTPAFQRQACANRPLYRKQYGADHPQVQKLESLCTQAGY